MRCILSESLWSPEADRPDSEICRCDLLSGNRDPVGALRRCSTTHSLPPGVCWTSRTTEARASRRCCTATFSGRTCRLFALDTHTRPLRSYTCKQHSERNETEPSLRPTRRACVSVWNCVCYYKMMAQRKWWEHAKVKIQTRTTTLSDDDCVVLRTSARALTHTRSSHTVATSSGTLINSFPT